MYTLRPMVSYQHFHQASVAYQLYLKTNGRLSDDYCIILHSSMNPNSNEDHRLNRMEQRLYWSCFKSEAEFRVELPLPQSEIATYEYPNLFPSPPSPLATDNLHDQDGDAEINGGANVTGGLSIPQITSTRKIDEVGLHAKKLCNEEESWYYYLTEVALRRIGNRIINTFFRHDSNEWLNIEPFIDLAVEFETQVSSWWANLPPAMQKYETNSTIRAPRTASPGGAEAGFVSQELSWATENRLLEMRSWLYQPFLYYLVHMRPPRPAQLNGSPLVHAAPASGLSNEGNEFFWNLIVRAIDCNITIIDTRSVPHRHHGLWYDLRSVVTASLILLAIIKSGYAELIPGGMAGLVGEQYLNLAHQQIPDRVAKPPGMPRGSQIRGKLGKALRQLEIWSLESPDMTRHREVLEELIHQIIGTGNVEQYPTDTAPFQAQG